MDTLRPELVTFMLEQVRRITGAKYAAQGVSDSQERLTDLFTSGLGPEETARIGRLPSGVGLLGETKKLRVPLRLRHVASHPMAVGFPPNHPPMKSFLGVPLRSDNGEGRVLGSLYLTEKQGAEEFSLKDEETVVGFEALAAIAMENDALYQPEEGPWVLLVEHDLRLIQTLRVIFERMRHGAIVVAVSDGLSAIALASQMSADLILLDLDIPLFNMDGIQVCTSLSRLTSAPIIMLSGLEATADIARGLEAGADDYVVKPFGSAVLGARAQALIRRSRMTATDVKTRAGRGGGEGLPG